ncbi:hypothetical protein [Altibacter sp.]|uniref:hypothetical protein n=1 Tax=Altibacter sp. TaxID=2024823 RepID=UPI0025B8D450|nr:hypothetical protein [Altibacter sp.]|tara:strand:+ start:417 stop:572 length:156 start_codon:yes stop_codon:yes gene_type:complete
MDKNHKSEKEKKRDQGIEESAINHKEKESDGREINYQEKQRREKHQPRDTA